MSPPTLPDAVTTVTGGGDFRLRYDASGYAISLAAVRPWRPLDRLPGCFCRPYITPETSFNGEISERRHLSTNYGDERAVVYCIRGAWFRSTIRQGNEDSGGPHLGKYMWRHVIAGPWASCPGCVRASSAGLVRGH